MVIRRDPAHPSAGKFGNCGLLRLPRSALAAERSLPIGCNEQTVIRDLSRAFERVVSKRYTGKQVLLGVDAYKCMKAEMDDAELIGDRPDATLEPPVRSELRKRSVARDVAA